jgi:hypothetical protein
LRARVATRGTRHLRQRRTNAVGDKPPRYDARMDPLIAQPLHILGTGRVGRAIANRARAAGPADRVGIGSRVPRTQARSRRVAENVPSVSRPRCADGSAWAAVAASRGAPASSAELILHTNRGSSRRPGLGRQRPRWQI